MNFPKLQTKSRSALSRPMGLTVPEGSWLVVFSRSRKPGSSTLGKRQVPRGKEAHELRSELLRLGLFLEIATMDSTPPAFLFLLVEAVGPVFSDEEADEDAGIMAGCAFFK